MKVRDGMFLHGKEYSVPLAQVLANVVEGGILNGIILARGRKLLSLALNCTKQHRLPQHSLLQKAVLLFFLFLHFPMSNTAWAQNSKKLLLLPNKNCFLGKCEELVFNLFPDPTSNPASKMH